MMKEARIFLRILLLGLFFFSTLVFASAQDDIIGVTKLDDNLSITKLTIETVSGIEGASLTLSRVDGTPSDIRVSLPGDIYDIVNIDSVGLEDYNIDSISMEFRMDKSWLDSRNLTTDSVVFYRKRGLLERLPTDFSYEDADYYYFNSTSPGFSRFVIFATTATCIPNDLRCSEDKYYQFCSEDYEWKTSNNCLFGCNQQGCSGFLRLDVVKTGVIVGVILAISIGVYLIWPRRSGKKGISNLYGQAKS